MLKQRVITAIVLLLILIGSYMLGPVAFAGVMAIAFILAQWEWLKLSITPLKSTNSFTPTSRACL